MPATLGIHLGHDRSASIVRDGLLQAHIAEERLDRIKHSPFLKIPFRSIDALLRQQRTRLSDFAAIGVTFTKGDDETFLSMVRDQLTDYYRVPIPPLVSVGHHMAHALSAFHTSGFEEALLFVADGSGDPVGKEMLEAESWFSASGSGIEAVGRRLEAFTEEIFNNPYLYLYPLLSPAERDLEMSLGNKYEQLTYLLGFGKGQEGTTMALASYGRPLVDVEQFDYDRTDYSLTRGRLLEEIDAWRRKSGIGYAELIRRHRRDLAATVQALVEHVILSVLTILKRRSGHHNLCLAGGVFLNCVLNARIVKSGLFDRVHVVPAAGDDGQAIGGAFHAYRAACGAPRSTPATLPYLGLRYSERTIEQSIARHKLAHERLGEAALAERIASHIAEGRVVGVLRGRSEAGPRALCHRSLLADPRSRLIRNRLNRAIKRREMFRPFAPVVTAENKDTFFEDAPDSPCMLYSANVRKKYRRALGGITHVDGSARLQTLTKSEDAFIYRLLRCFEARTGFPVLLNTSFNGRGEPLVESPEDAIACALANGVDVLALEGCLIVLRP